MGLPAARLTDPTVHGGTIIAPGCPLVLIGGLPAARITDMHVCPMVNGVVPHVGGPIILGAFTTLVGGMPQARQTDMLTCIGPPDSILMGCPTVLVGMVGGGAGFSSMGSGVSSGMGNPATQTPPPTPEELQKQGDEMKAELAKYQKS